MDVWGMVLRMTPDGVHYVQTGDHPMAPPVTLSDLMERRNEIQAQLAGLGPMRPGTLAQRFRKCGKPNCHCAQEGARGHGPVWSLTWAVEGKTRTRVIPDEAVEDVRAQVAEYQRCRTLTRAPRPSSSKAPLIAAAQPDPARVLAQIPRQSPTPHADTRRCASDRSRCGDMAGSPGSQQYPRRSESRNARHDDA